MSRPNSWAIFCVRSLLFLTISLIMGKCGQIPTIFFTMKTHFYFDGRMEDEHS
jgi:hypothetical protein